MPARLDIRVPRKEERDALSRELLNSFSDRPEDWFVSVTEPADSPEWHVRIEGPRAFLWSEQFEGPEQANADYVAAAVRQALAIESPSIHSLVIQGFGPFAVTNLAMRPLEVLVGANGSGKTSVFALLRAIRDFTRSDIPPEIIPGWETREVYHRPGPDQLSWQMLLRSGDVEYAFDADIIGPIGNPAIAEEIVQIRSIQTGTEIAKLTRQGRRGFVFDLGPDTEIEIRSQRANELAFRSYVSPSHRALHRLKEHIDSWRFFSGLRLNDQQLRQPALIERSPALRDDGGNLASVLNWLRNEYPSVFNELELHIRNLVPGFRGLGVRPSGAGRVTLTWDEEGLVNPLTAADLSDGSLRLLLWLTLALTPNPPALVCIDEPEVGLHPRTLPTIAGLLKKLSARTQVLVATHSSYLLAEFDVADVAILRKRNGSIEFSKPGTSATLLENLREFGADELELMHRSDELEALT